jgi:hypothetical protein
MVYMLVALAATRQPLSNADSVIDKIEGQPTGVETEPGHSCQQRDQDVYDHDAGSGTAFSAPGLQLECVRDVLHNRLFEPGSPALGAFRAAVADFLYQYKMMVLYRDTFKPYFASQAAAKLDAQLNSLVDAFSNDLLILEHHLVKRFEKSRLKDAKVEGADSCDEGIAKCKSISYAASGIVSFKTVTGIQSNVQTSTQNYFNATPPVTLGDLAAAIRSIGSPTVSGATVSQPALPRFLTANMTANEAVGTLAALQVLNRAPVVAKIGKGLNLTAEAYSAPGASGAELDITVQSTENGAGQVTAPTAGNEASQQAATDDLASRVAQHQVTTRVRVDSLNLFSVSTMESVLARGKAPWKILDPLVEFPVLSELVRVPRRPQLIYHRSFIFINAMLVPTAIDLGWGVTIEPDLVQDKNDFTLFRQAASLGDLFRDHENDGGRIEQYHKRLLEHFEADRISLDPNLKGLVVHEDDRVPDLKTTIRIDKSTKAPYEEKMIRIDDSPRPPEPNPGKQVPKNLLDPPLDP